MSWQRKSSEYVFENPWYKVRHDEVTRPDGTPGTYDVIEYNGAVFVVAVDEDLKLTLVKQGRYTTGIESYEIPAGGVDADDTLTAAKRELAEETGLTAENWKQLGVLQSLNGISDGLATIYLATNLQAGEAKIQGDEDITDMKQVPFSEASAMIGRGEISCAISVAAIYLANIAINEA